MDPDGSILSHASSGSTAFRFDTYTRFEGEDFPWVFGWNTEPFLTARVEPHSQGRLPTFGNIFDIDRVGIAVLGMADSHSHEGVVVYLQELFGVEREVALKSGVVGFREARLVDFLERDLGDPLPKSDETVMVPVRGNGVAAVRLSGLELNQA